MHSLDILLPIGRRLVPAAGCQRAAVRGDRLADHPLAEIARQEHHDAGDVVALPVAADGDPRRHEMLVLGGDGVVVHLVATGLVAGAGVHTAARTGPAAARGPPDTATSHLP